MHRHARTSYRRAAAAAALLISVGCATAGGRASGRAEESGDAGVRAAMLLSDWRPPEGQRCHLLPAPDPAPTAEQLVDTAAVRAAALDAEKGLGTVRGAALYSLKYDSVGALARSALLETDLDVATLERLGAILGQALRRQPPGPPWSARLRVDLALDLGAPPQFRVGRSEYCAPAQRKERVGRRAGNMEVVSVVIASDISPSEHEVEAALKRQMVNRKVRWEVVVSPEGRVLGANMLEPSQHPELERAAQQRVLALRFLPALDDRVPVVAVDTSVYHVTGVRR